MPEQTAVSCAPCTGECSMEVLLSTRNTSQNERMYNSNELQEQLIYQGVVFFGVLHFPLPFIKEIPPCITTREVLPHASLIESFNGAFMKVMMMT